MQADWCQEQADQCREKVFLNFYPGIDSWRQLAASGGSSSFSWD